jgi:hypothetical protein
LVALTRPMRGGGSGGGNTGGTGSSTSAIPAIPDNVSLPEIPPAIIGWLAAFGVALACFMLILVVLTIVVRYVSETAIIRMVDIREKTGEKRSLGQGFRLGWSRSALHLFLIDLLIGVPLFVLFFVLFILALAPLLLWFTKSTVVGVLGTIFTIGAFLTLILLVIVVVAAVSLLTRFFWRACVLEELGVFDALSSGFDLVRRNLKDTLVMWLIMVGVGILYSLVMIPVLLVVLFLGLGLGGIPGLLVAGIGHLMSDGVVPWLMGAAVGCSVVLLVVVVVTTFFRAIYIVFESSAWTVTYRELRALEPEQQDQVSAA